MITKPMSFSERLSFRMYFNNKAIRTGETGIDQDQFFIDNQEDIGKVLVRNLVQSRDDFNLGKQGRNRVFLMA